MGLCLWANPECVYFLVPCVVLVSPWILRGWSSDRTRTALELLCAATGVVVGGLPLWWSRFSNPTAAVAPYPGTLATRSDALVTHAAPLGLGFQVPGSGAWLGGEAIGVGVLVALIVAVVLGVTWALVGHQPRTITALVTFVVAYPIIYSLLPGTWYWHDGRYIVYLPYLFIVVALYPLGLLHGRRLVAATTAVIVLGAAAATASELTQRGAGTIGSSPPPCVHREPHLAGSVGAGPGAAPGPTGIRGVLGCLQPRFRVGWRADLHADGLRRGAQLRLPSRGGQGSTPCLGSV